MHEFTFAIIKPDAMLAGHFHAILEMITKHGLQIELYKHCILSSAQIDQLYHEHISKPFYPEIKEFMSSAPVICLKLSGENAVIRLRTLMGATNSANAESGTIRHAFGNKTSVMHNCIHGSDSPENAQREVDIMR